MYPVSEAYKREILSNERLTTIEVKITLSSGQVLTLGKQDICSAPSITNQCSNDNQLLLGSVFQGQLTMTFLSDLERYQIKGAKVELKSGLMVNGAYEYVPLGVYYVSECTRQGMDKLKITALDCMGLLDKNISGIVISGSVYDILSFVSLRTGIVLGQTEEDLSDLPNGTCSWGVMEVNDLKTYRDVVRDLSACLGSFATIGRDGKLYIKQLFNDAVVQSISADNRGDDIISDYKVHYTSISCTKNGHIRQVGEDNGQVIDLGKNAFLQLGLDNFTDQILTNILNTFNTIEYIPAQIYLKKSDPTFDLGDMIESCGYTSGPSVMLPVHKLIYTWRGAVKMTSYGEDPYSSKSKTEKAIENTISQIQIAENTVLTMVNMSEIDVGIEWTELYSFRFAVAADRTVVFNGVLKANYEDDDTCSVKYVLNGEDIGFVHEAQMGEGTDTVTLFIPIEAKSNALNDFRIYLKNSAGLSQVPRFGFWGAVIGSGIITTSWDGIVSCDDVIDDPYIQELRIYPIWDDLVSLALVNNDTETFTDSVPSPSITPLSVDAINEESFHIYLRYEEANLITESGDGITTENGDRILL